MRITKTMFLIFMILVTLVSCSSPTSAPATRSLSAIAPLPSQTVIRVPPATQTAVPLVTPTATQFPTPMPTPVTDPLPAGANLRLSKGPLQFVDMTSDGRIVVVGSRITICSYQVADGSQNWCRTTGQAAKSTIRNLSLSPDGKVFLTGLDSGLLILWDSVSGTPLWAISEPKLNTVAWSQDNQKIVISIQDLTLRILDRSHGYLTGQIPLDGIPPSTLAWSPDGKQITGGDNNGQVTVWDAITGKIVTRQPLFRAGYAVSSLIWTNDSSQLLVGSRYVSCLKDCTLAHDGALTLIDSHSSKVIWQIEVTDQVQSLAVSPDGRMVLARMDQGAINLYRISDGEIVQSIPVSGGIGAFWLAEGKSFLFLDGTNHVIEGNLNGNQQILAYLEGYYGLVDFAWSPDSKALAASPIGGPVVIWDRSSGEILRTIGEGTSDGPVAWSPDGEHIATQQGQEIIIWDIQSGAQSKTVTNPSPISDNMGWSPDGKLFASLCHNVNSSGVWSSTISIWDVSNWNVKKTIIFSQELVNVVYIAWSPDGKRLAGVNEGLVWDVATGKLLIDLGFTGNHYQNVQWSPDGYHLVTNSGMVWDINVRNGSFGIWGDVTSTAFSPEGNYLVTGGDRIVLRNPKDGSILQVLDGWANQPEELAFSPDNQILASLSREDGTVILWKVP